MDIPTVIRVILTAVVFAAVIWFVGSYL